MTDRIVRIKSSRPGYRRGGQEFGADWTEVDTSTLSRDQQRAILADGVLTIEGREGDGSWTSLSDEIRGGLLSLVASAAGFEGAETPFEVDPGVQAKADQWDDLLACISLHQPDLEGLKLWPFGRVDDLVVALVQGLGEAEAVIAARDAEISALNGPQDLRLIAFGSALAAYDAKAVDPDPMVVKHASAELSDDLDVLVGQIARGELAATNNPSDVQPGGGVGDPADPAGGEASTTAAPPGGAAQVGASAGAENGGEGGQADASSQTAPEIDPKPKPAVTPKPPAKVKGATSKAS